MTTQGRGGRRCIRRAAGGALDVGPEAVDGRGDVADRVDVVVAGQGVRSIATMTSSASSGVRGSLMVALARGARPPRRS